MSTEVYGNLHEARRALTNLWWTARDQASESPACCPEASLGVIEESAAKLAMLLNLIEDEVETMSATLKRAQENKKEPRNG